MTEGLNWDEFRIVLAIAETQSLAGGAERLGLNHSTMFRRLTALETRLGLKLFLRERSGYRTTAAGEEMVTLAMLMGDTIAEFERRVSSKDLPVSGHVRLTTLSALGTLVLPPICAALAVAHPGLHVELALTDTLPDLLRGEAHVALRRFKEAPSNGLVGRRIAAVPWAIYATREEEETALSSWVAPSETFGAPEARRWIERHVDLRKRVATTGSLLAMAELAARGVGAALLPCYVGVTKPQLRRVAEAEPDLDGDLWIVSHERALRLPRVRALYDFIGDELERRRSWFAGEAVVDP